MVSESIPDHPDLAALSAHTASMRTRLMLRNRLQQVWRQSWLFNRALGQHAYLTDIQSVAGPAQAGNPERGDRILRGEFEFSGLSRVSGGEPPWMIDAPADWHIMLHSFCWLDDLASSSHRDQARQLARDLMLSWCKHFWSWHRLAWTPAVMGARLCHILQHHDNFLSSSSAETRSYINACLMRQARCLVKDSRRPLPALTQVLILHGLTATACAFPTNEALQHVVRQAISKSLPEVLTPDGVTLDRCPETQVCLIHHLIEIRRLARSREWPEWTIVHALLGVAAPALKYIMQNDGGLPLMRGSGQSNRRTIYRLLKQSEWQSLWADRVDGWQIQRIGLGEVTAFLDTGPPTSSLNSALETRAPLALEVCVKAQRIITGCGVDRIITLNETTQSARSRHELRGCTAHSTLAIHSNKDSSESSEMFQIQGPQTWRTRNSAVTTSDTHQSAIGGWIGRVNSASVEHQRKISLIEEGAAGNIELQGTDMLILPKGCEYSLSFHLHPDIRVADGDTEEAIRLVCPDGSRWLFQCRGRVWVDDSIYSPDGTSTQLTRQLLIRGESRGAPLQIHWKLSQTRL